MYRSFTTKLWQPPRAITKILLIMRLTTLILITAIIQVNASSYAQKISLSARNAPLIKLLKEIRTQSGYDFLYKTETLKNAKPVTIAVKNMDLKEVLDKILEGQSLEYTIEERSVTLSKKMPSFLDRLVDRFANIDVRGKVVDDQGVPLVGATVKVKGTNKTTQTNSDGNFSLTGVADKAVLVITYLGFQDKEIAAATNLDKIILETTSGDLKEVEINAGYYTVKDRERTGSISRVIAETIEKQPISNPLQAIQGRVPGLQITQTTGVPGGGFTVQIRGQNSLKNGNDPLYIIDNVIYPSTKVSSPGQVGTLLGSAGANPLSMINPYDIESIEVLKDADATAIYGSKGANGVILIKTKRSSTGNMKINVSVNQGISDIDRRLELLNTEQYLEMRKEALANDKLQPTTIDFDINGSWDQNQFIDWQKELIGGKSDMTSALVTISGGSQKVSYTLGGNFYNEGTVFPGDFGFKRAGVHSSLSLGTPEDRFNATFTSTYNYTQSNAIRTDLTIFILLPPNAPSPYDEQGGLNWSNNTVYINPMSQLLRINTDGTDNLIGNFLLNYKILKNLNASMTIGYTSIKREEFRKSPFTSFAPVDNPTASNRLSNFSNINNKNLMFEPQINYNSYIGVGKLEALLGMSFQKNIYELRSVQATGFNSDQLMENIASASTITSSASQNAFTQYNYMALFARINYSHLDRYFINLTARRDGSSRFGEGKRFANFGAIGAAWIFSDDNLLRKPLSFLSFGKLRASFGITGNDQIPDYGYLQLWNSNSGTYQGMPTIQPVSGRIGNPDFAWEINRKAEAAIQIGLLKNRLTAEISYYRNRSSNQLIGDPLPFSSGNSSVTANRPATVQNTGWEFDSNFKILTRKTWHWAIGLNLTIPNTKLIAYPNLEASSDAINYIIGKPLAIRKIYNVRGVNSQTGLYDIEDYDGNGIINDNDRYLYKFTGQYYYGGIQNSLRFKEFHLEFLLSFTKQNGANYLEYSSFPPGYWYLGSTPNQPSIVLDRWKQPNDKALTQKFSTLSAADLQFTRAKGSGGLSISDASFIRLKNISLSYNLPQRFLSRLKINEGSISLQGQNIFTIINTYEGLDPETQGLRLPPLRTIAFGVNLTF